MQRKPKPRRSQRLWRKQEKTVCTHHHLGVGAGPCSHTIMIRSLSSAMKARQKLGLATHTILLQCGVSSTAHIMPIRWNRCAIGHSIGSGKIIDYFMYILLWKRSFRRLFPVYLPPEYLLPPVVKTGGFHAHGSCDQMPEGWPI